MASNTLAAGRPILALVAVLLACGGGSSGTPEQPKPPEQPEQPELPATGTARASVGIGGEGNDVSLLPALSSDGRYLAFASGASNLVAGDTNGRWDVFVLDRDTGELTRVSVSSAGAQANGDSTGPSISNDGRYVGFRSAATDLVTGDANGQEDAFVHDRETGVTTRVSVTSAGAEGNSNVYDYPVISGDGRYVAFASTASNLVGGDDNGFGDVFVHDRQTGATTRVNVTSAGVQSNGNSGAPSISADGRYVAFQSWGDLVPGIDYTSVFVHDRQTGETTVVSVGSLDERADEDSDQPAISGDGRYVAFRSEGTNLVAGDDNGALDVFVHDRQTGTTVCASVDGAGALGDHSSATPSISADGRSVAFLSSATNLVAADANGVDDVFIRDLQAGTTVRASVSTTGAEGNGAVHYLGISGDGRFVAFDSAATNLVDGDTNGQWDVFVRQLR